MEIDIQPYPGCIAEGFAFHGFTPAVIQIKPFSGFGFHKSERLEFE
jgi:hypothetical protein